MATFIFTYRVPRSVPRLAELDEADRAERGQAWGRWFESISDSVLEMGNPVNDSRGIGTVADTRIGGYSLVSAASFEEAVALAQGCPGLAMGGGVEVGEVVDMAPALRPAAVADTRTGAH